MKHKYFFVFISEFCLYLFEKFIHCPFSAKKNVFRSVLVWVKASYAYECENECKFTMIDTNKQRLFIQKKGRQIWFSRCASYFENE